MKLPSQFRCFRTSVLPLMLAASLVGGFTGSRQAQAACCYFSAANNDVLQPAQKAFITWDPASKTETFTVQPKFEGEVADFGMVIPTPTQPKLDEMPRDFFKSLAVFSILEPVDWEKFSKPRLRSFSRFGKAAVPPPSAMPTPEKTTVKVIEAGVVGTLDYKILTAEKADDLYAWLKENEYHYGGDEATLEFYLKKKWFFTVMKIDTKQIRKGFLRKAFVGELTPTRFSFKSTEIVYPLHITQLSVKDTTEALFYVQAPQKVDLPGQHSYQDSWQWMWHQAFDTAEPAKMTVQEKGWYSFVKEKTQPCFTRVKKLQEQGLNNTTLEWCRKLSENDMKVFSGEAKYTRDAPAADVAALSCLRGHLQQGQVITKLRKVFTKSEMTQDLVFKPASFGGKLDTLEYTAALPSSPP